MNVLIEHKASYVAINFTLVITLALDFQGQIFK